jgi:DNA replication protein DnaC
MERLNDIFGRTPHKRQPEHDSSLQTQRGRPAAPSTRRPLPEQTARLGQYAQHQQHTRPSQGRMPASQTSQASQVPQGSQPHLPPYTRSDYNSAAPVSHSPAPGRAMSGRPAPVQEHAAWSRQRSAPSYSADTYHPMVEADIEQELAGEWEDDTATLQYGDWESDRYEEPARVLEPGRLSPPPVSRGASRIAQSYPQNQRSLVTRELRRPAEDEDEDDPRIEQQAPAPRLPGLPALPAPSHRVTQPLTPSSPLSSLNRLPALSSPLSPRDEFALRRSGQSQVGDTAKPLPLIPAPYVSPKAICPICKGAGFLREDVPYGHPNFGKPVACKCKERERQERRRAQLQEMSNLSELKFKTFENFNPYVSNSVKRAFEEAKMYAEEPYGWLLFMGKVGCGKTHLAAAIANRALERDCVVLFSTVIDLLDHLRIAFMPSSTEVYDQVFNKMREAELLVLDDYGAHKSNPWAHEKLFQLLNYRYNYCMPTIITANNSGLQGVDDRIISRLNDEGLVNRIYFSDASDYRPHNPPREQLD